MWKILTTDRIYCSYGLDDGSVEPKRYNGDFTPH